MSRLRLVSRQTIYAAIDGVDTAVAAASAAQAAQVAAQAAAAVAEDISNIAVPDDVVEALVNNSGSDTYAAIAAGFMRGQIVTHPRWGADPTGATDSTAAIQACLSSLNNGDTAVFPRGSIFKISSTLLVSRGVMLYSEGYGDVTPTTSTAMTSATQGPKLLWAGGASPMVHFIAPNANETLHGGGVEGLILDAANVATACVRLSSCRNTKLDFAGRRYVTQGIILDDTNGKLISEIYIPRFVGRIESNAATAGAHGIYIKGDVSATGFGATSIYMGNIDVEHENGDAIRFEDVDSCYVAHLKAVNRTSGYTGYGVRFMQGDGAFPARKNYIAHLARGRVMAETGTANAAGFVNSEGGAASGPGIFHYRVIDRNTGELFQPLVHKMSDWITLSAAALGGTATSTTASGNLWAIRGFDATTQQYLSGAVPMPHDTEKGNITKVEVLLCRAQAGDANNDVRLQADLMVVADGGAFTATPTQKAATVTIPAATGSVQRTTITFDTPVAVSTRNKSVFLKLTRVAADAADTYTGILGVFAIRVYFEGTGPDDPGTGPWYVPPVSI